MIEYNLLKAYDRGELSIGQVATILNLSKVEVIELLEKYDIPYVRVDSEYLDQEFSAFERDIASLGGSLHHYADASKIKLEDKAWDLHIKDKYQ